MVDALRIPKKSKMKILRHGILIFLFLEPLEMHQTLYSNLLDCGVQYDIP